MTLDELLKEHDFSDSLLLGYYGGGNFGDELLLEVLLNLFAEQKAKKCEYFVSADRAISPISS